MTTFTIVTAGKNLGASDTSAGTPTGQAVDVDTYTYGQPLTGNTSEGIASMTAVSGNSIEAKLQGGMTATGPWQDLWTPSAFTSDGDAFSSATENNVLHHKFYRVVVTALTEDAAATAHTQTVSFNGPGYPSGPSAVSTTWTDEFGYTDSFTANPIYFVATNNITAFTDLPGTRYYYSLGATAEATSTNFIAKFNSARDNGDVHATASDGGTAQATLTHHVKGALGLGTAFQDSSAQESVVIANWTSATGSPTYIKTCYVRL